MKSAMLVFASLLCACGEDFTYHFDAGDAQAPDQQAALDAGENDADVDPPRDDAGQDAMPELDAALDANDAASMPDASDAGAGCKNASDACNQVMLTFCNRLAACCAGQCSPWANAGGQQCIQNMAQLFPTNYKCSNFAGDACPATNVTSACDTDTSIASCPTVKMINPYAISNACMTFWSAL